MLLLSETPATGFTLKAFFLLFLCDRGSIFQTEDLIHWFTRRNIVAWKPTLTIKWAGIPMLAPIRVFRWMSVYCARQPDILPNFMLVVIIHF
ncbi:MAG: hypothetical protein NVS4B11_06380 [Ktedonobacteraceae bacterium]